MKISAPSRTVSHLSGEANVKITARCVSPGTAKSF
jgi:hypothetical protein